ncbi:unnamed protein product [Larinioides sclopetarius]|uniref:Uncharacterized protein n=1 Tax=Larinioides sclopetarius TaxID=280406 RepID=A0AAV2A3Y5_9ARAC
MATGGGGWRIQKGYEGQKFSVKRFAYDVLSITLSKCGFPETHLKFKVAKENDYRHTDYVIMVHSAVICIALSMRDKWKHMFEYQLKRSVLNDMKKVEMYLVNIEVLPELRMTYELDKIRRSLAFYSELILFLHSNNIEVDFKRLLFIWTNYFNEKIAVKEDPDILLEAIFIEDPDISGYLSLVDCFIQEVAIPYGKIGDVSKRFRDFCEEVEKFYREVRTDVLESTTELLAHDLESPSYGLPDSPSEAVEESVSFFSAVLESDSVSSEDRTSHESAGHSDGFPLPSSSERAADATIERVDIASEKTPEEMEVIDKASISHPKSLETPSEMATGGVWRIQKGYEEQKFNIKRFAYDVLHITLSKFGFPKTHLLVKFEKENDYRHSDYVITVHSAVMCITLSMRDKWKRMFEYQLKRSVINDMQKVEAYLAEIEVLPEFRMTDDLDKIRRSLAFYSELILFLHSYNIEVDFEKFLDIWEKYFNEKIAVNEDSDILLEAIFIDDPNIVVYLSLVNCFIQEVANPYGKTDDVSRRFLDFSEEVEKFHAIPIIGVEEMLGGLILRRMKSTSRDPPPETVKESVSFFSKILGTDLVYLDYLDSTEPPEHLYDFPLPSSREIEDRLEQMNLVSKETSPEREDENLKKV